MSAFIYRIKNRISFWGHDRNKDKKTNFQEVQSLDELLHLLDEHDSKVYGKEIINRYEDDVDRTILLVSHELSLTGAPIVLLHLGESLKRRGFQVIIISGLEGDKFSGHAVSMGIPVIYYKGFLKSDMILSIRNLFFKIVISTIKCVPIINLLNATDSSVMWWIHEAGESYQRGMAKEMPRELAPNIRIYSGGSYARKMLVSRFPRYEVKDLTYGVPDLTRITTKNDFHIDLPDKKIFALFGTVQHRKGQDVLQNAIERLSNNVRDGCFFLFIGTCCDSEITNGLNELTKKYPNNVLYIEEVRLDDLYQLYKEIDFLVCASRDDPMPVVVAESMSLGKPCICSEFTGSAAVVHHYKSGFVYRHNSSSALARRIEEACVLTDDAYERMSRNARSAFIYVFSEQVFEKKIDRYLEV